MGIAYRGVVIVGYTYEEFEQCIKNVDWSNYFNDDDYEVPCVGDAIEWLNVGRAAPYYDADSDDCIFGDIIVQSGSYSSRSIDLQALYQSAAESITYLQQTYGLTPRLYVMAMGS